MILSFRYSGLQKNLWVEIVCFADSNASCSLEVHPVPIFDMIEVRPTINRRKEAGVLLKTILNRVQKYKGFVYKSVGWDEHAGQPSLVIKVQARTNSRAICPGCGKSRGGYDKQPARRLESPIGDP